MYLGIASSKELNTSFSVKNMQDFQKNNGSYYLLGISLKILQQFHFSIITFTHYLLQVMLLQVLNQILTVKEFNSKTFTNNIEF